MNAYITPPFAEPPEPEQPVSGFDSHRALSQPPLPDQDTAFRLFAHSQTYTERESGHTEFVRDNMNEEAFGEREFNKHLTEGGMSWTRGDVARRKR